MKKVLPFGLLITISLFTFSCYQVYFDKPQPIDLASLSEIPKKYRGKWNGLPEFDTVIITKNYVRFINYEKLQMLKATAEASDQYVITKNKIYEKGDYGLVKGSGYTYSVKHDTIYATMGVTLDLHIGGNLVVKKFSDGLIVNYKDENGFWTPLLVRRSKSGTVLITSLKKEDLKALPDSSRLIHLYGSKHTDYYEGRLTQKDFLKIMEQNGFSDTLNYFSVEKRY